MAAQLPWLVDLASFLYDVDWWLSGRVLALHSVVTVSISSEEDYGIHCWRDLIRSKQLSSVSVCHVQMFAGFSGHGNSIDNIIPQLKKENEYKNAAYYFEKILEASPYKIAVVRQFASHLTNHPIKLNKMLEKQGWTHKQHFPVDSYTMDIPVLADQQKLTHISFVLTHWISSKWPTNNQ